VVVCAKSTWVRGRWWSCAAMKSPDEIWCDADPARRRLREQGGTDDLALGRNFAETGSMPRSTKQVYGANSTQPGWSCLDCRLMP